MSPQDDEKDVAPDWELEQIRKVAAKYPDLEAEELKAELAATLVELKHKGVGGIRDWKAYLSKCLLNRASKLARKWRARLRWETSSVALPEAVEAVEAADKEDDQTARQEPHDKLTRIRKYLDQESFSLLKLLAKCNFNQSQVARELGVHRNTIPRRLQRIRERLRDCPIEKDSYGPGDLPKQRRTPIQLSTIEHRRLAAISQSHGQGAFRAKVVLALGSGLPYETIQTTLHTGARTIARWKRRFEKERLDGLKTRHASKKPVEEARIRVANWLNANRQFAGARRASCRRIARELGLSKSTVYRIISKPLGT